MTESIGTIYTYPGHTYGNRIRAVVAVSGLNIDFPAYTHGETNKTPEFLAKFPAGKIPAFEGKNGFKLAESGAIARYVAGLAPNSGLLGSSPEEAALVDQWMSFADTEVDGWFRILSGFLNNYMPYSKPLDMDLRQRIFLALDVANAYLQTRTYLVGHRLTIADIFLACALGRVFTSIGGPAERARIPNVVRFFQTIVNQPSMKPVFGEIKYAEKPAQHVAPAKAAAPPKEKAAPKPKAPVVADDDEDEPSVPEEPKAKNPLDLLPKSTLNLEDWKRAYSNMDTRGAAGSLEWFYEKYDPTGFSIWKVTFKYPEELTKVFMSSNLIGGFFNRLEASRKYLFGSVGVLGKDNDSTIQGVFITRGDDIKLSVDCAPDWESYTYEKMDLSKPDQKAFFEGALAWDLESGGKKWADGKNYK